MKTELAELNYEEFKFLKNTNKYFKWYWNICENAKDRNLSKEIYTENHHIYPKSIYGKNDILVRLTFKEHYIVHLCLWLGLKEIFGVSNIMTRKMSLAFTRMNHITKYSQRIKSYDSTKFSYLKTAYREACLGKKHSEETKNKIGEAHKNKFVSLETRNKISNSRINKFYGENNSFYGKKHSEESKRKISNSLLSKTNEQRKIINDKIRESRKNQIITQETREKLSKSNKKAWENEELRKRASISHTGKIQSEETKQKISKANKGRKHSEETKQKIGKASRNRIVSEETKLKNKKSAEKRWKKYYEDRISKKE